MPGATSRVSPDCVEGCWMAYWMLVYGLDALPFPGAVAWTSTYQVVCAAAGGARRAARRNAEGIGRMGNSFGGRTAGGGDLGPGQGSSRSGSHFGARPVQR